MFRINTFKIPLETRQWWLMPFIGALGRQSRSTEKPYLNKSKKKKATIGYLCMLGDRLDNLNDGNFLNFFFFLISSYLLKNFLVCGQSYLTLHLGLPGAVWLPQIQSIGWRGALCLTHRSRRCPSPIWTPHWRFVSIKIMNACWFCELITYRSDCDPLFSGKC